MNPIIQFSKISQRFKDTIVLNELNLTIFENEIFGLIGFSGSGKTTLLRDLMGFYKPTSGNIFYKDSDLTHNHKVLKSKVGFTTQNNSFYFKLKVEENLKYFGRLYGLKKEILEKRIDELLHLVRLFEYKKILSSKLSGGMQRRLDFAISLIHDPEILILDEPTTGLDPIIRSEIWGLIQHIHKTGKTIIVASHLFDEIETYCSRIGIMSNGKINCVGELSFLKSKLGCNSLNEIFKKVNQNV